MKLAYRRRCIANVRAENEEKWDNIRISGKRHS